MRRSFLSAVPPGGCPVQIICRPVGDVPLAWADPVGLAVVADNLLSNAIRFSGPGGEITVQTLSGPGGVVCSVRDRGPRLSGPEYARLFHGGLKVGPAPTAGEPSRVLGLAIAKEFIERLGGRLWAESELGEGACFSIRIPYHAGAPSDPPRRPAAAASDEESSA